MILLFSINKNLWKDNDKSKNITNRQKTRLYIELSSDFMRSGTNIIDRYLQKRTKLIINERLY